MGMGRGECDGSEMGSKRTWGELLARLAGIEVQRIERYRVSSRIVDFINAKLGNGSHGHQ